MYDADDMREMARENYYRGMQDAFLRCTPLIVDGVHYSGTMIPDGIHKLQQNYETLLNLYRTQVFIGE